MTILDIRYWRLAVFTASACIATVLSGCAGEGDEPVPSPVEGEVAEVPVTITFGTAWEQDDATRVPPPGQEADPDKIDGWDETDADKVRIVCRAARSTTLLSPTTLPTTMWWTA